MESNSSDSAKASGRVIKTLDDIQEAAKRTGQRALACALGDAIAELERLREATKAWKQMHNAEGEMQYHMDNQAGDDFFAAVELHHQARKELVRLGELGSEMVDDSADKGAQQ